MADGRSLQSTTNNVKGELHQQTQFSQSFLEAARSPCQHPPLLTFGQNHNSTQICSNRSLLKPVHDQHQSLVDNLDRVLIGKFSHGRPAMATIKAFFKGLKLQGVTVDGLWIDVKYDVVPPYCVACWHIGHSQVNCKRAIASTIQSSVHEAVGQGNATLKTHVEQGNKQNCTGVDEIISRTGYGVNSGAQIARSSSGSRIWQPKKLRKVKMTTTQERVEPIAMATTHRNSLQQTACTPESEQNAQTEVFAAKPQTAHVDLNGQLVHSESAQNAAEMKEKQVHLVQHPTPIVVTAPDFQQSHNLEVDLQVQSRHFKRGNELVKGAQNVRTSGQPTIINNLFKDSQTNREYPFTVVVPELHKDSTR